MAVGSDIIVQFSSSAHVITTQGKTLKITTQRLRHLKPDDSKNPLFEKTVTVRAIDNKTVETTEVMKEKELNATTKCSGFEEKDLDQYENEWNELWNPLIEKNLDKN
jgi:hypothetical protein